MTPDPEFLGYFLTAEKPSVEQVKANDSSSNRTNVPSDKPWLATNALKIPVFGLYVVPTVDIVTVGGEVYPLPPVTVICVILSLDIVTVALPPDPPPPEKVTIGFSIYPAPPFVMVRLPVNPPPLIFEFDAVAVACVPPVAVLEVYPPVPVETSIANLFDLS